MGPLPVNSIAVFMVVSLVCRDVRGLQYQYPPAAGEINQKLPKPHRWRHRSAGYGVMFGVKPGPDKAPGPSVALDA